MAIYNPTGGTKINKGPSGQGPAGSGQGPEVEWAKQNFDTSGWTDADWKRNYGNYYNRSDTPKPVEWGGYRGNENDQRGSYTVRPGDSYAKIAGDIYGDQRMFADLIRANPGSTILQPGQVIRLPEKSSNPVVPNEVMNAAKFGLYGGRPVQEYKPQPGQYGYNPSAMQSPDTQERAQEQYYSQGGTQYQYGGESGLVRGPKGNWLFNGKSQLSLAEQSELLRNDQKAYNAYKAGGLSKLSEYLSGAQLDNVDKQYGVEFGLPAGGPDTMRGKFAQWMGSPLISNITGLFGIQVDPENLPGVLSTTGNQLMQGGALAMAGTNFGFKLGGPVGATVLGVPAATLGWMAARVGFEESWQAKALGLLNVPFENAESAIAFQGLNLAKVVPSDWEGHYLDVGDWGDLYSIPGADEIGERIKQAMGGGFIGAAEGATVGTAFGPAGTGIGALAGLVLGGAQGFFADTEEWKAGQVLYESSPALDIRTISRSIDNFKDWTQGKFSTPFDDPQNMFVDYDLPTTKGGLSAVVELRDLIDQMGGSGAVVYSLYDDAGVFYGTIQDKAQLDQILSENPQLKARDVPVPIFARDIIASRFGAPGQIRDLLAGFTSLDPLDAIGEIASSATTAGSLTAAKLANATGNTGAAISWARLAQAASEAEGVSNISQQYRNILVNESMPQFREGVKAAKVFNTFERLVVGKEFIKFAETGEYTPPKWWQVTKLTPSSVATETVVQGIDRIQAALSDLDWTDSNTPGKAMEWLGAMAKAEDKLPQDAPDIARLSDSIQGQLVKRALNEAMPEVSKVGDGWEGTKTPRGWIETIAKTLNTSVEDVVKRIDNGEADALLKKSPIKNITPEMLTDAVGKITSEGIPYTPQQFRAAVMSTMAMGIGKWAAMATGIKPASFLGRLAAATKGIESVALLGLNVTYPLRNWLNGEITMLARGAWGLEGVGKIRARLERMGISPARIASGLGAADIGADLAEAGWHGWGAEAISDGMRPIQEAAEYKGVLAEIQKRTGDITSKLPPTKIAQIVERWQSVRAYSAGLVEMWNKTWRRGIGFDKMKPELEAALRTIDPSLPKYVYAAVEGGFNMEEITKSIFAPNKKITIVEHIEGVGQSLGLDAHAILNDSGFMSALDDEMADLTTEAGTPEIIAAFERAKDRAKVELDQRYQNQLLDDIEHTATTVNQAGPVPLFEAWDAVLQNLYETQLRHTETLRGQWDEISRLREGGYKDLASLRFEQMRDTSNKTWQQFFDYQHAQMAGMVEGLKNSGMSVDDGYLSGFDVQRGMINEFHQAKNKILDQAIADRDFGPGVWDAAQGKIDKLYNDLAGKLDKQQAKMDNYILALSVFNNPTYGKALREWFGKMREFTKEDMRRVSEFRKEIAKLQFTERNKRWIEFSNERVQRRAEITREMITARRSIFGEMPPIVTSEASAGSGVKVPVEKWRPEISKTEGLQPGTWWRVLGERYGLNVTDKGGNPMSRHFQNAINKYISERMTGDKVPLSAKELRGLPSPDRLNEIIDALENRTGVKAEAGINLGKAQVDKVRVQEWMDAGLSKKDAIEKVRSEGVQTEASGLSRAINEDNIGVKSDREMALKLEEQIAKATDEETKKSLNSQLSILKRRLMKGSTDTGMGVGPDGYPAFTKEQEAMYQADTKAMQDAINRGDTQAMTERRVNETIRRQVDDFKSVVERMSREELIDLVSVLRDKVMVDKTGIASAYAWQIRAKKAFEVHSDVDGLKWINDNFGHTAGDALLQSVAEAFKDEGVDAYHISGDEFHSQFDTDAQAQEAISRVTDRIKRSIIKVENPDGSTLAFTGASFSYGIGDSNNVAEVKLKDHKAYRESIGERSARGERPSSLVRVDEVIGQDTTRGEVQPRTSTEAEPTPTYQRPGYIGEPGQLETSPFFHDIPPDIEPVSDGGNPPDPGEPPKPAEPGDPVLVSDTEGQPGLYATIEKLNDDGSMDVRRDDGAIATLPPEAIEHADAYTDAPQIEVAKEQVRQWAEAEAATDILNADETPADTGLAVEAEFSEEAAAQAIKDRLGAEKATRAAVTYNDSRNGIEIRFKEKPDAETLAELRRSGYKWSPRQKIWYAKQDSPRAKIFADGLTHAYEGDLKSHAQALAQSILAGDQAEFIRESWKNTDLQNFRIGASRIVREAVTDWVMENAANKSISPNILNLLNEDIRPVTEMITRALEVEQPRPKLPEGAADILTSRSAVLPNVDIGRKIEERGQDVSATPTPTERPKPDAVPGQSRTPDRAALAEVSAQESSRPGEQGRVETGDLSSPRSDGASPSRSDTSGDALPGRVGSGEGVVGVSTERGRPRTTGEGTGRVGRDYVITDADAIGQGSLKQKAKQNIAAIQLLRKLEDEGRLATPEEQAVLVKYTGWGALPQVFNNWGNHDFINEAKIVEKLLTEEEYEAARRSTLNAHFTSPVVIRAMWEAMRRLGFDGGKVIEPSMGAGHFFGLMPEDLIAYSKRIGVELDTITGGIAKQLYQAANIHVKGYQEVNLPNNYFDLAISNVPFGNFPVFDKMMRGDREFVTKAIHNYFFAKALDQVRDGGIVAFITSRYTMDAKFPRMREYLAERADFLGAVRLPNDAFKANAGTEVVTDIIFLRKRAVGEAAGGESWVNTVEADAGNGQTVPISEYYYAHPEMVLGDMKLEGSMYRANEPTWVRGDRIIEQALPAALANLPEGIMKRVTTPEVVAELSSLPAPAEVREGAWTLQNGNLYRRSGGVLVPADFDMPKATADRARGMTGLKEPMYEVLRANLEGLDDAALTQAQVNLNAAYDSFVSKNGPIHSRGNILAMKGDPDLPRLLALERIDPETGTAFKEAIFNTRTINRVDPVSHVDSGLDAMVVSLAERGRLDWERMAELTGKSSEDLQTELRGNVYKNPEGDWEAADQYLSGNVRGKLAAAIAAAEIDPSFSENVEALRKVQPKDLEAHEIKVKLGASWIDTSYISEFAQHLFGQELDVRYHEGLAQWMIDKQGSRWLRNSAAVNEQWGTGRMNGLDLLEKSLNSQSPTIKDKVGDNKYVVNEVETLAARAKQDLIRQEFDRWIFSDPERAEILTKKYNELFNTTIPRVYDAQKVFIDPTDGKLRLKGMSALMALRPHQADAIWRIIQGDNTLLAHVVGAGKTMTMIGAGMEMRRTGKASKVLYVVPNHMLEQFSKEFIEMYPTADVLMAEASDFGDAKSRAEYMSRIAVGNYDGIVVTQNAFEALPVREATFTRFLTDQVKQLEDYLFEMKSEKKQGKVDSRMIKEIEKSKATLEAKIKKLGAKAKDEAITWDELGIDQLFVDEAHMYKNLFFPTRQTRISGIGSGSGSDRAFDMFVKTQALQERNNGGGVVFSTGTPIANSVAEMYTMQRYLQMPKLRELGIEHFDAWSAMFGDVVTAVEMKPTGGGFRTFSRFARFNNVPELLSMFKEVADIRLDREEMGLKVPEVVGGKAEGIVSASTPELKQYINSLVERAEHLKSVDPRIDNMLKITGDGRRAALDIRLVKPNADEPPTSKANNAAAKIFSIYKDTADQRLTQLVFIDLSTPKEDGRFNVYDLIKGKLIEKGIPENEIAFIHDAANNKAKQAIFDDVRSGKIRVIFGSTEKMGVGTNIQNRLVAEHHLDSPWRPADIEQRDGRIIRQGNMNEKVNIYRYITSESFDVYMWQLLESKARFINQVMSSKVGERSIEDVDTVSLSYAEMKALATGNPAVMELVRLDTEIKKLDALSVAHKQSNAQVSRKIFAERANVRGYTETVSDLGNAIARYEANKPAEFNIEIEGTRYLEQKEADAAISALIKRDEEKARSELSGKQLGSVSERGIVGEYAGFTIYMYATSTSFKDISYYFRTDVIPGKVSAQALVETDAYNSRRIINSLDRLAERRTAFEQQLEASNKNLAEYQAMEDRPFEGSDKLGEMIAKREEIRKQIEALDDHKADQNMAAAEDADNAEDGVGGGGDEENYGAGGLRDVPYFETAQGRMYLMGKDAQGNFIVKDKDGLTHIVPAAGDPNFKFLNPETAAKQIDTPMPLGHAGLEAWNNKVLPVVNELQSSVLKSQQGLIGKEGASRAPIDENTAAMLNDYLGEVGRKMPENKLLAMKWGEHKRDQSLLNYSRRWQYNNLAGGAMPYEFFATQSMAKWAMSVLDNPQWLSRYYRLAQFLNTEVQKPGFPKRLAGRVRIPAPMLPEWAGGGLYVDPLSIGLPLEGFAQPYEQMTQNAQRVDVSAKRKLSDMLQAGQITQAEYDQAMKTQAGKAWDRAVEAAKTDDDNLKFDAVDFASLIASPHLPLQYAWQYARGTQDRISPLPLTKQLRAMSSVLGIGGPTGFNLEEGARRKLDLPIYDEWEDYRVDRQLADLAAEGVITNDQALAAMIDKSGAAYEMAKQRAAKESGYGTVAGMIFGAPAAIYPEGEEDQRKLTYLYKAAQQAQDNGDTEALQRFFEFNPEYESRLALYKDPEERLQQFLISQVWQGYMNLPKLYKREVEAMLGSAFEDAFLNKDTRDYSSIDSKTLATWARTLGRYVPINADGPALELQFAPPQIAAKYEQYRALYGQYMTDKIRAQQEEYFAVPAGARVFVAPSNVQDYLRQKDQLFPGINSVQDGYYALPKGQARRQYLRDNPNLKSYWDWKAANESKEVKDYIAGDAPITRSQRSIYLDSHPELAKWWQIKYGWLDSNPDVKPYVDGKDTEIMRGEIEAQSGGQAQAPILLQKPEVWRVTYAHVFADKPLPSSVERSLMKEWRAQFGGVDNPPIPFEQWLQTVVAAEQAMLPPMAMP